MGGKAVGDWLTWTQDKWGERMFTQGPHLQGGRGEFGSSFGLESPPSFPGPVLQGWVCWQPEEAQSLSVFPGAWRQVIWYTSRAHQPDHFG
jgi:hypothetical protein